MPSSKETDQQATPLEHDDEWVWVAELESADLRALVHSLLLAHDIQHRFGALHYDAIHPGPNIPGYDLSQLTVRRADVELVQDLLSELAGQEAPESTSEDAQAESSDRRETEIGSWWTDAAARDESAETDAQRGLPGSRGPESLGRAFRLALVVLAAVSVLSLALVVLSRWLGLLAS